jgi:hypothetical protein
MNALSLLYHGITLHWAAVIGSVIALCAWVIAIYVMALFMAGPPLHAGGPGPDGRRDRAA